MGLGDTNRVVSWSLSRSNIKIQARIFPSKKLGRSSNQSFITNFNFFSLASSELGWPWTFFESKNVILCPFWIIFIFLKNGLKNSILKKIRQLHLQFLTSKIHHLPLRFRTAEKVWCGGARETHWATCHKQNRGVSQISLFFIS